MNSKVRLLEMQGITKDFPGVRALSGVSFEVNAGEIVCLLGENGAGKSTLMKILTGVYPEYEGNILLEGETVAFRNTHEAGLRGISMIFQELNLCPNLSAAENLLMGREIHGSFGLLDHRAMRRAAREYFEKLDIDIDPTARVADLSVAKQQMVEIAKAISRDLKILIMDEPTSALTDKEIQQLFTIMRELKSRGIAIVFISHKLDEVLQISDRITVLRDGKNAGEMDAHNAAKDKLISLMVGRELGHLFASRKGEPSDEVVMEVRGLCGPPNLRDISFSLHKSEILGLAGLIGAGRTELARLLIGAERPTAGDILIGGRRVENRNPAQAVKRGLAYVPEDRKSSALILDMSVRENLTLSVHKKICRLAGLVDFRLDRAITDKYVSKLGIKISSREQPVKNLSGGNQQKLVIGKSLAVEPNVLILDEPTRGIDVGAKSEVHRIIAELADAGMAILMISSELQEILGVADRILVMHEGRLTADFPRNKADQETIMKAAISSV